MKKIGIGILFQNIKFDIVIMANTSAKRLENIFQFYLPEQMEGLLMNV